MLCVPFAASIGGIGTFTGTDLNLYLSGYYNDFYAEYTGDEYPDNGYFSITYANWAMYNLLPSFLTFLLSYIWLQAFCFGFNPIRKVIYAHIFMFFLVNNVPKMAVMTKT